MKVTLRAKKIKGGKLSLYLDFYPAILNPKTGKTTRRQFLKKYVLENPKTTLDKRSKKETLLIAEQIRAKRENELFKEDIYSVDEKEKLRLIEQGEQNFIAYFEKLMNKRTGSNLSNWRSAYKYLYKFTGGELKFNKINTIILDDFKEFLLSVKSIKSDKVKLSRNSAVSYFNKVKASLKQAFQDDLLQIDINSKIKAIKTEEIRREFLTEEELNTLIQTHCNNSLYKKAAIFSALTGVRFSDIQKLKWKEVEAINEVGYFLNFTQKKTYGVEVLPIPEQAYKLMGDRKDLETFVFEGLKYSAYNNRDLYDWIKKAGITKDITFHCFRHTYATLQLYKGTDLYTVSKLLGHKDLKTTQIYAKIVDKTKQEAVNKLKLNFDGYEF